MLQVLVLMVGKTKAPFIQGGVEYYARRLRPYLKLSLEAVREEKPHPGLTAEEIRRREGERLLARLPRPARLTVLEAGGREMTSEELAGWLTAREMESGGPVVLAVGGHLGLAPAVVAAAAERLSLSRFTFTHELARLVLLEQLYRAATIKAGHPYHL